MAMRSHFLSDGEYIAVRVFPNDPPIKIGDKFAARRFRLRKLYNRRRIGLAGDDWTNNKLKEAGYVPPVKLQDESVIEPVAAKGKSSKKKSKEK